MVQLGSRVKDTLTGFKGIAIGRCEYLHGCAQILIKPEKLKNLLPINGQWIDEQRVITINKLKVKVSKENSAKSGGYQQESPNVR